MLEYLHPRKLLFGGYVGRVCLIGSRLHPTPFKWLHNLYKLHKICKLYIIDKIDKIYKL